MQMHSQFFVTRVSVWSLLVPLLLLSGCYTYKGPQYLPSVELTRSSTPIQKKVLTHPLVDRSPEADKETGLMQWTGSSATAKGTLKGELAELVTQSLIGTMRRAHLFESIEADQASPDLVLTGTIHRFYERANEPMVSVCCGFIGAFIGVPLLIEEGEIDIEIVLSTPEGKPIKNYRKRGDFNKWMNGYDGRAWKRYSHGFYLNRIFSEVASQFIESISSDRAHFETATPRSN